MKRTLLPALFLASGCAANVGGPPASVPTHAEPNPPAVDGIVIVDGWGAEPTGACGAFESGHETTSELALAGRLRLQLPTGSVSMARPHDVMSAPNGDDEETRFLVDREGSRMVIFVEETFASAGDDLARAVVDREASRVERGRVFRVRLPSGLDAVVIEPTSVGGPPGGVFVDGAFVVTADGTVASVRVFVTPDVASSPESCRRAARRILTSIAAGDARLDLSGGDRTLRPGAKIRVPPAHVLRHDEGPDFDVFEVIPVAPLGQRRATLGLYFGNHPSFQPAGEKSPTTLFGLSTSWWTSGDGAQTNREAPVTLPGLGFAHVFLSGDRAQVDALTTVAETSRYEPR